MYERFSDRARKVMQLANRAAQELNHEYIGTEHVLIGLCREGNGIGCQILKRLGNRLEDVVSQVCKLLTHGPEMITMGKLPQTPRAKKVINYAIQEAASLKHNHVGSEHILLGLLREKEGIAHDVLTDMGVTIENARQALNEILHPAPAFRIEKPGFYKQRNGEKAEALGKLSSDNRFPWIGADSRGVAWQWSDTGRTFENLETDRDLVAPWTESVTKEVIAYLFRTPQGDEYVGTSMRSHLIIDEKIASARVTLTEGQFAEDTK